MTGSAGAFMTVCEVAKELGISPTTAYRLVASRQIPTVRLRGRVRVPRAALREWLRARSREALASVDESDLKQVPARTSSSGWGRIG